MVNDYSDSFITEAILATILEKRIERRKKSMHQKILLYRDYIKPSIPLTCLSIKLQLNFVGFFVCCIRQGYN